MGGEYWYKVEARKVEKTPFRPHGIKYCITLHDPDGQRIFGIDNAHAITEGRKRMHRYDHVHRGEQVTFYEYRTAADLMRDFFDEVLSILKERGVDQ